MAFTLGLTKEFLNYIKRDEIVKNDDDTYKVPFINGKTETFNKKDIKKNVMEYIEANKNTLEPALNSIEEPKEEVKEIITEIAVKEETGIVLRKETQTFIEDNIEDLKAMLMEYRLNKGTGKFDSYIKLDIPQFVKDIPVDTVLSVKGNKETYKKFKNFAELHGVSVGTLFNYLIYSLLNGFNAW
ncbi:MULTISPECIES: hypothetical protein [Fusobacterium]|mgnify:CR=1 FL=1|jgi:hypothetical protein|uniref:Uncharacterized protein n=2 Tax=Fusobacterium TaxID=848 RepID=Q7BIK3_FUSNU|nr:MULTISPECIES: hypothetical protein [Fusobacterium]AAS75806.1 hypothetical protein [Fusobacterium nucleatum]PHI10806.1 hypothetical protein CBG56_12330 [Fusobacterium polymorphum]